jgi:Rrf2 family iron-sulfur cluster assembly transcriptional regulator
MKLSTKSRYAVTALFDIASNGDEPVSAKAISGRQGISVAFLEQIFKGLRKNGILKTQKGPSGGYMLNKLAAQISIGEIIRAVDGPIVFAECVAGSKCLKGKGCCSTRPLWNRLSMELNRLLEKVKLSDLAPVKQKKGMVR